MTDYELFRPYFVTQTLRLSYGAAKLRARSRWQRDLEHAPAAVLVRRLQEYGFAALYLNRKGFEDRADRLLQELSALGYDRRLQSRHGNQVVVLLRPAERPHLPLARVPTYGQGWHLVPDNGTRWAFADAVMSYYNPLAGPITVELDLSLLAVSPRTLTLTHEGQPVGTIRVDQNRRGLQVPGLVLAPGVNRFRLESDEPPDRQGQGRYQLRSFGLTSASFRVRSAQSRVEAVLD